MEIRNRNSKIKVVIAEDHVLFKKAVRLVLSSYDNIEVTMDAENGLDLLGKIQVSQPDVILLDLTMPIMDGFTVLPIIKKEYPLIKVVILTLYDDDELRSEVSNLGACAYVLKTDTPACIYKKISDCYKLN